MTIDMTAQQALGEVRNLSRTFKSLAKLDEVLSVVAELEQREIKLKDSVANLEKEEKEYDNILDKVSNQLVELTNRVDEQKKKAESIVSEATKQASALKEKTEVDMKEFTLSIRQELQNSFKQIEDNKKDIVNSKKELDDVKKQVKDVKSQIEVEKARIVSIFKSS